MKVVKRKKSSRYKGRGMGTAGTGARKNKRGSGCRGGKGMSGTGKRADHKKTLIQKMYGHKYFGKQGITRGNNKRDIRQRINIGEIQNNLERYGKKGKEGYEILLKNYKILGNGEVKDKLIITCLEASKSAIEKIEKAGGKVVVKEKKIIDTPKVTFNQKE
ncbi:MAG TPA: uL15 family ribosomal protein [Candidatus Nanoarchaeia archaeon]|nr:uL15 family ribosomal protein [Candidatus Nanoarchaeia archaeon]